MHKIGTESSPSNSKYVMLVFSVKYGYNELWLRNTGRQINRLAAKVASAAADAAVVSGRGGNPLDEALMAAGP